MPWSPDFYLRSFSITALFPCSGIVRACRSHSFDIVLTKCLFYQRSTYEFVFLSQCNFITYLLICFGNLYVKQMKDLFWKPVYKTNVGFALETCI